MQRFNNVIEILKLRPARRIALMAMVLTVIIGVVFAIGSFVVVVSNEVSVLEGNLSALPAIMDEQVSELTRQYDVYNGDFIARGDLAVILYNEFETLDMQDRLDIACENIDAETITVMNGEGKVIATTAEDGPSIGVTTAFGTIDNSESPLFDPNMSGLNEKVTLDEEDYDPEADTMPMVFSGHTDDGNVLMAEFDYAAFGKVYADQGSLSEICKRILAGMEGYAFIQLDDGTLSCYSSRELTEAEEEQAKTEAKSAFKRTGFDYNLELSNRYNTSYFTGKILGESHLFVKLESPNLDYSCIVAVPVANFINSMLLANIAIIALVIVGFVLFNDYCVRIFRQNPVVEEDSRQYARQARRQAFPGAIVVAVVSVALATMLLMLESMSNTAQITMTQQESLYYETEYRMQRKEDINEEYSKRYLTRSTALAFLLSGHPELRTRGALQRLNRAVNAEYLMLFDKDGNELFSTNGFTGFTFADESSGVKPEWKPVLQGYEQVETPTEKNPITGTYERTIATLVKDAEDLPDGVLVVVVNDDDYMAEIGDASVEGAVKSFSPPAGQMACVIDNETGQFVAHTNDKMMGEDAKNYIDESLIGRDFEGYTTYDNKEVYVSGISVDGKTAMVIARDGSYKSVWGISGAMIASIAILFLFVYYPFASVQSSKYARLRTDLKKSELKGHPMTVFYHGYVFYLAVLAVTSLIGIALGVDNSGMYVFSGKWTPGIHLFSIWSSLFTFALFSYVMIGMNRIVTSIERVGTTHTKTFARLINSLLTYLLSVVMVIFILSNLGVNTATIIGSISIVSIAVGMGTQDLVKDIVAGIFLVFESTLSVGDIVDVGGWRGRVTDMGIRTTELTNEHNDVKIFTNSNISSVVNYSKVKTLCMEEFEIPRTVEIKKLPYLVDAYIKAVVKDVPEIQESLCLDEIMGISEDSYTVRLSYTINENQRESITLRLRNAMQLLLESGEVTIKKYEDDEEEDDE